MYDQRSTWGSNFLDASIGLKFDMDNPDDILYRFNLLSRSYSQSLTSGQLPKT